LRHTAVQEHHFAAERFLKVRTQDFAHFGELRKYERAISGFQNLLNHLSKSSDFARTINDWRTFAEELCRVIADLLRRQAG